VLLLGVSELFLQSTVAVPTIDSMCSRWLRLLPLFVAALWLPFQAIAATTMPFCRHGEAQRLAMMQAAMADEAMDHCHMHDQKAPTDHGMNCDDCGFCHLAGAGFMPATERAQVVLPVDREFESRIEVTPASVVSEPPQRPPRRVA